MKKLSGEGRGTICGGGIIVFGKLLICYCFELLFYLFS
jgi:hypothetical protein